MRKQYEIFAGSNRCEIAATNSEARAYACGMSEAFKMAGQPTKIQVYNVETGNKVFETKSI